MASITLALRTAHTLEHRAWCGPLYPHILLSTLHVKTTITAETLLAITNTSLGVTRRVRNGTIVISRTAVSNYYAVMYIVVHCDTRLVQNGIFLNCMVYYRFYSTCQLKCWGCRHFTNHHQYAAKGTLDAYCRMLGLNPRQHSPPTCRYMHMNHVEKFTMSIEPRTTL